MLELQSIPHVGEQIFAHVDTPVLLKFRSVSKVWKKIAEEVLVKRWKDNPFLALENNEVGVIKLLLEHPKCVEINWNITKYYDIAEITPLMLACRNGLFKVVELFLDYSVTRNIDFNKKHTLGHLTREGMHAFCSDNGANFDQIQVHNKFIMYYTAFSYACHFGHKDVVELMLNNADTKGIDLKSTNENGKTILSMACRQGQTEVVKLLLRYSVTENMTLNVSSVDIMTVFTWACRNGHGDIVQMLVDHYAKHIERNGLPAFRLACKYGHKEVVKVLLDHSSINIGLNAKESYGYTAFMLSCNNGHKDIVKLLLDHPDQNIDLNARDNHGQTAFMAACNNGHKDVVELLLEHADPNIELNAKDGEGNTAFMLTCRKGHIKVVKLLFDKVMLGLDITVPDFGLFQPGEYSLEIREQHRQYRNWMKIKNGWTSFMMACHFGHEDNVKWMLDNRKKMDPNAQDSSGRTAFMLACSNGHKDVVHLLLEYSETKNIDISTGREELSNDMRGFIDMFHTTRQK